MAHIPWTCWRKFLGSPLVDKSAQDILLAWRANGKSAESSSPDTVRLDNGNLEADIGLCG